jgi:hypothetical protein
MRIETLSRTPNPGKKAYVPPKLVVIGSVTEVPSLSEWHQEEKAKREMRRASTKNQKA